MSTGQVPNSADLGLEKAGIETDKNGFIRHDRKLQTSVPGIWVMGDVKGSPAFTHVGL
jgi:pyruvate/2-oxoglutarate dehydrogenase complex dihydrolipoamide dehydrogenase (E3) component